MNEYTFTLTNKNDNEQYCHYSIIEWRDVLEERIGELFPHAKLRAFGGSHATVLVDDVPHRISYALLFPTAHVS